MSRYNTLGRNNGFLVADTISTGQQRINAIVSIQCTQTPPPMRDRPLSQHKTVYWVYGSKILSGTLMFSHDSVNIITLYNMLHCKSEYSTWCKSDNLLHTLRALIKIHLNVVSVVACVSGTKRVRCLRCGCSPVIRWWVVSRRVVTIATATVRGLSTRWSEAVQQTRLRLIMTASAARDEDDTVTVIGRSSFTSSTSCAVSMMRLFGGGRVSFDSRRCLTHSLGLVG